jgi:purine-nucleoside phosphorylase
LNIQKNLAESTAFIRTRSQLKPRMGIVLGSGLGAFVNEIDVETSVGYDEIPGFIAPSVEGHGGRLILGHVGNVPVACLQGRIHYYEGHTMAEVVHPIADELRGRPRSKSKARRLHDHRRSHQFDGR